MKPYMQSDRIGLISQFSWNKEASYVMDSIVEGKKQADVCGKEDDTLIVIWDRGHFLYVNAKESNTEPDLGLLDQGESQQLRQLNS
ncbi:hypothetical protein [Paenibacillus alvei]|uniref:hypothetical protein n=1 Tax=Paenibacillus alvei TaxID=44250 RepID=UPI0013D94580|nr:hypothetical protein [Paenibacillus alvei]NEZ45424.1 hypothetical protein [Paenibacillus alvei]